MVEVDGLQIPAELSSAATVRRKVATDLAAHGLPRDLIDDVVLVASELVTNAVRHASSLPSDTIRVSWDLDGTGVSLCVVDGGGGAAPAIREAAPGDTAGRGLSIVASIADRWGVEVSGDGHAVWAHLPQPQHAHHWQ